MYLAQEKFDIRRSKQALKDTIDTQESIILRSSNKGWSQFAQSAMFTKCNFEEIVQQEKKKKTSNRSSQTITLENERTASKDHWKSWPKWLKSRIYFYFSNNLQTLWGWNLPEQTRSRELGQHRMKASSVKPRFTDTRLIQTPHHYGQLELSLGKESPYVFSTFNPLNTLTPLVRILSMAPLASVLAGVWLLLSPERSGRIFWAWDSSSNNACLASLLWKTRWFHHRIYTS